ncbi:unnamed protein product, partial [Didymodactylos carnosus]
MPKYNDNVQMLGISHSGVRLIKRTRTSTTDTLQVIETFLLEEILHVSNVRVHTIDIRIPGKRITLHSHR